MPSVWGRMSSYILNRTFQGVDRAGNQYFTRTQLIDGIMKEKRWVIFKKEDDPMSIPVEWISWLNGQRKRAPTPEEMAEMEANRERVKLNVALLKKEEEERKAKEGTSGKSLNTGKVGGPDLKSFIQQFPVTSEVVETLNTNGGNRSPEQAESEKKVSDQAKHEPESSEPTGSGQAFRPGTWQPPT